MFSPAFVLLRSISYFIFYGQTFRKSFASFSFSILCLTMHVRLLPNLWLILSAPSLPASSLSIHMTILSNWSKIGSSLSGRLVAPWGREIAGYPVCWCTAIASNSPSVITMNLSLRLIVFKPKKPVWLPLGNCLVNFLFSEDPPLTLILTNFTFNSVTLFLS